jgi:hypothetical protein
MGAPCRGVAERVQVPMPAIRSIPARLSVALLCGAAAVAVFVPLAAQEGSGLRGAMPSSGLAGQASPLQRNPREPLASRQVEPLAPENPPLPAYRPVGQGAVPEPTTDPRIEELLGARPRVATQTEQPRRRPAAAPTATASSRTATAQPTRRPGATTAQSTAGQPATTTEEDVTGSVSAPIRPGMLPAPDDTPRAPNEIARRVDAEDLGRGAIGPDAERTGGIETRGAAADASPYAPTGIRAGSLVLRPTLEQGAEWSSNASATAGGSSDILSSTTLRLGVESEWERHAVSLNTFGTYRTSLQGTGFSELTAGLDGSLRLDLGGGFTSTTEIGYQRRPESADLAVTTVGRPLRQTFSAATTMAKTVGPVLVSAKASADRNVYADATLDTGGTVSQAGRNNTLYALTLRGGYEVSPALQPFVETEVGRRIHDARIDAGGFARSATRYGARAGLAFDRGEKFTGEVAAGFLTERPDDSRLSPVSGLTLDANLGWSPLRGTQVNLAATTEIEASALAGAAGALVYGVSLGATREFSARLTGAALLSAELRRYAGTADTDTTLGGTASLTWWLNRYAGITGRVGHERLSSTVAGRGYGSTTVYLGVTLQR